MHTSQESHAAKNRLGCIGRSTRVLNCISSISLAVAVASIAHAQPPMDGLHASHAASAGKANGSPLIDKVRAATAKYVDIEVAMNDGWVQGSPCVSGPQSGAMGVHFVLPSRIPDGVVNASEPEALIYEPMQNGAMRLVGVEFIVLADDWARTNPNGGPPAVDGHLTNFVGAPNRYGLPAFHELHVWAWEHNPNGSFADWNSRVSCDSQPPG